MRKRRFFDLKSGVLQRRKRRFIFGISKTATLFEGFERAIFSRYVPEKAILDTYCRCFVVLKEVAGLLF